MKLLDELKTRAGSFLPKKKPFGLESDFTRRMDSRLAQQRFDERTKTTQQGLEAFRKQYPRTAAQSATLAEPKTRQPIWLKLGEGFNEIIRPNFDAAKKRFDSGYKAVGDWLEPTEFTTFSENARKQGVYGVLPGNTMEEKHEWESKLDSFKPLGVPVGSAYKFLSSESDEVTLAREKLMRGETLSNREKNVLQEQQMQMVIGMSTPLKGEATAKVGQGITKAGKDKLRYLVRGVDDLVKGKNLSPKAAEMVNFDEYTKLMGSGKPGAQTVDDFVKSLDPVPAGKRVNLLDYLRTPDRVLSKIGLKKQSDFLRVQYDKYVDELPNEINKITGWSQRVSPESNERIFRYLDGEKIPLDVDESKVAAEVKDYLSEWATKLKLPKEKRITNYITHIFDDTAEWAELDPEIAKMIENNVAGSVYNPFLQTRKGGGNYVRDTWRALDAYSKRAVRKYNLDPALEQIKLAADDLESSQFKYVKSYIDRVNLRPTEIDNLLDNLIKSSPVGFKFGTRPTNVITTKTRQAVYRGMLGLNPGSALKNLSQGSNTYALLGERYTVQGYAKVAQNIAKFVRNAPTELDEVGVLGQDILQDRALSSTKKFWQNMDEGLFYMFNLAEKINRGAAYWGAKSKFLAEGLDEAQAIARAKDLTRQTQFAFGSIDTPVALQSDIAKTLTQFMTYGVKQTEFLAEMAQNKNAIGAVRWIGSSLIFVYSVGKALGMEPKDLIPGVRFGVPPTGQVLQGGYDALTKTTDDFGNELTPTERILNKNLTRGALNYVPAGSQIRKSVEGTQAVLDGGSYSKTGKLRYPVEPGLQPILFGSNNTQSAKDYFKDGSVAGDRQTELYKSLVDSGMQPQRAFSVVKTDTSLQDPEQKQGVLSKARALWNGLFGKEAQETIPEPSDPLQKAWADQEQDNETEKFVKELYSLNLSRTELDAALQKKGITSEEAMSIVAKSLEVESGARGEYLRILFDADTAEFTKLALWAAEEKILTSGVIKKWFDDGDITEGQKKMFEEILDATSQQPKKKGKKIDYKLDLPAYKYQRLPESSYTKVEAPKIDVQDLSFRTPRLEVTSPRLKQRIITGGI